MKKILLIVLILFILTGCNNDNKKVENKQENTSTTKLSTTIENSENISLNTETNIENNLNLAESNLNQQQTPVEEELNVYTSKVLDKSADRVNNLQIACNILNNHIINPGETFSFNDVLGEASEEKGYKKAKVFDSNGNVYKDYGGGVCQVSSTLFNAIEPCNIEIVERHHHSKRVYYVPEGKDAAISHDNCDFKFKNNNQYPIKIYSSADKNNVTIRIVKMNKSI